MSGPGGVDDRQVGGEGQPSSLPSRGKRGRRELPEKTPADYGGRRVKPRELVPKEPVKSRKPVEPEEREEQVAAPLLRKRAPESAETSAGLSTKRVKKGKAGSSFSELEPAIYLRNELTKLARSLEARQPKLAQLLHSACNSMSSDEEFYKALKPFFDRTTGLGAVRLQFTEDSARFQNFLMALHVLQANGKTASLTRIDALERAVHDSTAFPEIVIDIAHCPQGEIDDLFAHVTAVCAQLPPDRQTLDVAYLIKCIPLKELSRARGDIDSLCREVDDPRQVGCIAGLITIIPEQEQLEVLSSIAKRVHDTPQGIAWGHIMHSLGAFPEDLRAKMLPKLIYLFQGLASNTSSDLSYALRSRMEVLLRSFFVEQMPDLLTQLVPNHESF